MKDFINSVLTCIKRNAPLFKVIGCILLLFVGLFAGWKIVAAIAAALGSLAIGRSAVKDADAEHVQEQIDRAHTVSDEVERRQEQRRKEAEELREGLKKR